MLNMHMFTPLFILYHSVGAERVCTTVCMITVWILNIFYFGQVLNCTDETYFLKSLILLTPE